MDSSRDCAFEAGSDLRSGLLREKHSDRISKKQAEAIQRAKECLARLDGAAALEILNGMLCSSGSLGGHGLALHILNLESRGELRGQEHCMTSNDDASTLSSNGHRNTNGASSGKGVDGVDASESKADVTTNGMPPTLADDFVSMPSSIGTCRLPFTQIVNRGGTINLNYNIYHVPASSHDEERGLHAVDGSAKDREGVSTPTPDPTYSSSPKFAPTKLTGQNLATSDGIMVKFAGQQSSDQSRLITRSWGISEIEKQKLKDSIALMFMGDPSRKDLTRKLKNLVEAIRTEKWDARQQAYIPIDLGPDSSSTTNGTASSLLCGGLVSLSPFNSEDINIVESATQEQGSLQAQPFDITQNSLLSNGSFQCDPSRFRIDAKPRSQVTLTDRSGSSESNTNRSHDASTGMVAVPTQDQEIPQSGAVLEALGKAATTKAGEPIAMREGQDKGSISNYPLRRHGHVKLGPGGVFRPAAVTGTAEPEDFETNHYDKSTMPDFNKRPSEDATRLAQDDAIDLSGHVEIIEIHSQDSSCQPQGQNKTSLGPNPLNAQPHEAACASPSPTTTPIAGDPNRILRQRLTKQAPDEGKPKDNPECGPRGLNANRKPAKLDAKTSGAQAGHTKNKGSKDGAQTNHAPAQKVEKPRSKKPAATAAAEKCDRDDTDTPASSSVSDSTAARTAVLNMVARLAGHTTPGAQGHRDFSFLLGPTSDSRKCRLCRNMFTDKSNVRQQNGGAPCSFHPGILEDKTGDNTTYAFSCCGGPPIMVGPNLVAMNLVSPGCTKCYHQDKRSAWNLETFKMKDPVLFED